MQTVYRYYLVSPSGTRSPMNFGGKTEFSKPLDSHWVQLNFARVIEDYAMSLNRPVALVGYSLAMSQETVFNYRQVKAATAA